MAADSDIVTTVPTNTEQRARHPQRMAVLTVLVGLYIAQAIPVYLVAAAMPAIFRAQGISLVSIGSMALLMLPWVLKFLWAPVVDRFYIKSWANAAVGLYRLS